MELQRLRDAKSKATDKAAQARAFRRRKQDVLHALHSLEARRDRQHAYFEEKFAEERKQHAERWTPPTEYLCPITQELMRDPVSTVDGHTYERAAIERWLSQKRTSPSTGAALSSTALIPNHALRKLIEEHMHRRGQASSGT